MKLATMKLGVFIEKFLSRCDDIKIQQLFSNIETNVICIATEEGQKVMDKYKDKYEATQCFIFV